MKNIQRKAHLTKSTKSLAIAAICFFGFSGAANGESVLSATLSLPVSEIKEKVSSLLPSPIYQLNQKRQTCVPAKWASTKIPEFRGLKWYTKTIKTKISPEITCDISGIVQKNGDLTVRVVNDHLEVQLPINLSVTAKGRGAIGRNISETAKGATTITVRARPSIDNNWRIHGGVDINYRWDKAPHIVLFNIIPITFASEVNPKINELINQLVNEDLPEALAEINLKNTVSEAWNDLQDPIALGDSGVSVSLNPSSVTYNGININQEKLHTRLSIGMDPLVTDTENLQTAQAKPLPALSLDPATPDAFLVNLPVHVGYAKLNELIKAEITASDEDSVTVLNIGNSDERRSESLTIEEASIEHSEEHSAIANIAFKYRKSDRSTWLRRVIAFFTGDINLDGVIQVSPDFTIDESNKLKTISANLISVDTNSKIADVIGNFVASDVFQGHLSERLSFPVKNDLERAKTQLEEAINGQLSEGVQIRSNLEVLNVSEDINFTSEGVELNIGLGGRSSIAFDRSVF